MGSLAKEEIQYMQAPCNLLMHACHELVRLGLGSLLVRSSLESNQDDQSQDNEVKESTMQ